MDTESIPHLATINRHELTEKLFELLEVNKDKGKKIGYNDTYEYAYHVGYEQAIVHVIDVLHTLNN